MLTLVLVCSPSRFSVSLRYHDANLKKKKLNHAFSDGVSYQKCLPPYSVVYDFNIVYLD